MCGIIFSLRSKEPTNRIILKRYENQKNRGREGFGYITIQNGFVENYIREREEMDIKNKLEREKAPCIMFHHRLPTSTPNFDETAHPIKVSQDDFKYDYYVVHNGVISNDDDLYKEHSKLGYEYTTKGIEKTITTINGKKVMSEDKYWYNDSECLAIELALLLEGKKDFIGARGSIAFVCIQTEKNGKVVAIYYGRNSSSPLKLEKCTGSHFVLKSEGNGQDVKTNILFRIDYETGDISEREIEIGYYYNVIKKENSNISSGWNRFYDDDDSWKTIKDYARNEQPLPLPIDDVESLNAILQIDKELEELHSQMEDLYDEQGYYEQMAKDETENLENKIYYDEKVKELESRIKVIDGQIEDLKIERLALDGYYE